MVLCYVLCKKWNLMFKISQILSGRGGNMSITMKFHQLLLFHSHHWSSLVSFNSSRAIFILGFFWSKLRFFGTITTEIHLTLKFNYFSTGFSSTLLSFHQLLMHWSFLNEVLHCCFLMFLGWACFIMYIYIFFFTPRDLPYDIDNCVSYPKRAVWEYDKCS